MKTRKRTSFGSFSINMNMYSVYDAKEMLDNNSDIYNGMCYVRNATPKALMTYFKRYNKDGLSAKGLSAKMEYRLNRVYKALRALQRNEINF